VRLAFADESGTDATSSCYGIGVLAFPEERRPAFDALFAELRSIHRLDSEQKWEAIDTGYSRMNFLLDWLHRILVSAAAAFDLMVVNKGLYRLWNEAGGDRETAFYKTYTYILTHAARRTGEQMRVFIDDRSDEYPHQPEVIQIVGNHMLKDLADAGRLGDVTKVDSTLEPAIQVADLLTGAITAAHRIHLNPADALHPGKLLAISRVAEMFDWPDIVCDTMPDSRFNVWHFPKEYRAKPATRTVGRARPPRYVTWEDVQKF
jgi:hypothetical protein